MECNVLHYLCKPQFQREAREERKRERKKRYFAELPGDPPHLSASLFTVEDFDRSVVHQTPDVLTAFTHVPQALAKASGPSEGVYFFLGRWYRGCVCIAQELQWPCVALCVNLLDVRRSVSAVFVLR